MLISCPECSREVSDHAKACPGCGFPIDAHVAAQKAERDAKDELVTRTRVGETDCPQCEARGFVMTKAENDKPEAFYWCSACHHTGRVELYESSRGYWAVQTTAVEAFVHGADENVDGITLLGTQTPEGHRFDRAGPRHESDE